MQNVKVPAIQKSASADEVNYHISVDVLLPPRDPDESGVDLPTEIAGLPASAAVCFWKKLDFRGRSLEKLRTFFSFFILDTFSSSLSELQREVTAASSSDVGVAGLSTNAAAGVETDPDSFGRGFRLATSPALFWLSRR